MTVVVYRDGILAADTQLTSGSGIAIASMTKIIRCCDGALAGGSGDGTLLTYFLKWAHDGREGDWDVEGDFHGFVIMPGGTVLRYEDKGCMILRKSPFYALGSGSSVALGALEMGATAKQAVKAAIKYSSGCGGEITSLSLEVKTRRLPKAFA